MSTFNWTCPHCHLPQVVTDKNYWQNQIALYVTPLDIGKVGLEIIAVGCLNEECKKLTLSATLHGRTDYSQGMRFDEGNLASWRLLPESSAIPQPAYIPSPITESYYEACKIRDLSPKASATLARRCLQGMIRDFCKIAKGTLDVEIKELRKQIDEGMSPAGVTPESVDAIDQVRSVGNIGAHMEKNINLIVDVDPGEAQALIELVEMLFEEWYVARHQRGQRLAKIAAISAEKKAQIAEAKLAAADAKGPSNGEDTAVFFQTPDHTGNESEPSE
jgi:hypothetical protein